MAAPEGPEEYLSTPVTQKELERENQVLDSRRLYLEERIETFVETLQERIQVTASRLRIYNGHVGTGRNPYEQALNELLALKEILRAPHQRDTGRRDTESHQLLEQTSAGPVGQELVEAYGSAAEGQQPDEEGVESSQGGRSADVLGAEQAAAAGDLRRERADEANQYLGDEGPVTRLQGLATPIFHDGKQGFMDRDK